MNAKRHTVLKRPNAVEEDGVNNILARQRWQGSQSRSKRGLKQATKPVNQHFFLHFFKPIGRGLKQAT